MKLVDTTFLIDVLKNRYNVGDIIDKLEETKVYTTEINVFEIYIGIFTEERAKQKLADEKVNEILSKLIILNTSRDSILKSAQISTELIKQDKTIEATDCLIAGIALVNGVQTIVTRNVEHFKRIKELKVETY